MNLSTLSLAIFGLASVFADPDKIVGPYKAKSLTFTNEKMDSSDQVREGEHCYGLRNYTQDLNCRHWQSRWGGGR